MCQVDAIGCDISKGAGARIRPPHMHHTANVLFHLSEIVMHHFSVNVPPIQALAQGKDRDDRQEDHADNDQYWHNEASVAAPYLHVDPPRTSLGANLAGIDLLFVIEAGHVLVVNMEVVLSDLALADCAGCIDKHFSLLRRQVSQNHTPILFRQLLKANGEVLFRANPSQTSLIVLAHIRAPLYACRNSMTTALRPARAPSISHKATSPADPSTYMLLRFQQRIRK